jgi:hypothetical protein
MSFSNLNVEIVVEILKIPWQYTCKYVWFIYIMLQAYVVDFLNEVYELVFKHDVQAC